MRRLLWTSLAAVAVSVGTPALADDPVLAPGDEDLSNLSIEDLAQIKVRSASKRDQPLGEAPTSIYVIDHDRIVRSGAITIPEILRLAPNLQVYQRTPGQWVVTARGLNGNPGLQSFSNKLLVLVDGRTVYAPHFSGVYWDLPDLIPDDIERIEVISGPGATLWGANAVNGVINIITRSAGATSGAYADVQGGTVQQAAGLRFGGSLGKDVDYRVYGRWLHQEAARRQDGGSAHDGWRRLGAGFRIDWAAGARDTLTLQGDIFGGKLDEPGGTNEGISGHNVVARWSRDSRDGHGMQLQLFYDRIHRSNAASSPKFHIDTYDADFQHSFALGKSHEVVWGGGARIAHYAIGDRPFSFDPASRDLFIGNLFVQDSFEPIRRTSITAGLKVEHDPFVGFSLLPNLRVAFTASDRLMLWGAASRAVRSATPFDTDVRENLGNIIAITGNPHFRTEKLTAFELGARAQPTSALSLSVTAFYHRYHDLRSIEIGSGPALLNLFWGNGLEGHTKGIEAWATVRPLPWWTLSAGATLLSEEFDFKSGATATFLGTFQNGVDPAHQFTLRSSMDLGSSLMLDLDFRAVGKLRHTDVPAYAELGGRLTWTLSDRLALTLSGSNLLHERHVEYPDGDAISRKVLVGLQWRP